MLFSVISPFLRAAARIIVNDESSDSTRWTNLRHLRHVRKPSRAHPTKTNKKTRPKAASVSSAVHTSGMVPHLLEIAGGGSESGIEAERESRAIPFSSFSCFSSKISSLMAISVVLNASSKRASEVMTAFS